MEYASCWRFEVWLPTPGSAGSTSMTYPHGSVQNSTVSKTSYGFKWLLVGLVISQNFPYLSARSRSWRQKLRTCSMDEQLDTTVQVESRLYVVRDCNDIECLDIQYQYGAFCSNGQASIGAKWWSSNEFIAAQPPHHVAPESRPVLNLQTKSGWYRKLDTQGNARWYLMILGWLSWSCFWVVQYSSCKKAKPRTISVEALRCHHVSSILTPSTHSWETRQSNVLSTVHPTSV